MIVGSSLSSTDTRAIMYHPLSFIRDLPGMESVVYDSVQFCRNDIPKELTKTTLNYSSDLEFKFMNPLYTTVSPEHCISDKSLYESLNFEETKSSLHLLETEPEDHPDTPQMSITETHDTGNNGATNELYSKLNPLCPTYATLEPHIPGKDNKGEAMMDTEHYAHLHHKY